MVSARRNRRRLKMGPDSSVRRNRRGGVCSARRSNGGPLCSARRTKGCVFAVGAALECFGGARVESGDPVERLPRDGVPARLVRALALHSLVNEAGRQKLALRPLDHVSRRPAARCQVGTAGQQPPVVVADVLARHLHQQRARRVTQGGPGGAIEHGPGQGYEPARVSPGIALPAAVAAVCHQSVVTPRRSTAQACSGARAAFTRS
jgi:hypothetical protein